MKSIYDLPPEMLDEIFAYLSLNDKLRMRAVASWLNNFLLPIIPELIAPEQCVISSILLSQLDTSVEILAMMDQNETALHFVPLIDKVTEISKIKKTLPETGVFCSLTCSNSRKDFSLFLNARIGLLRIDPKLPFRLTSTNINWLRTMLNGCEVDTISLVVGNGTVRNIELIPELLTDLKTTHLELILQDRGRHDLLRALRESEFARKLSNTYVKKISLGAERLFDERSPLDEVKPQSDDYEIIEQFLSSGVSQIVMDMRDVDYRQKDFDEEKLQLFMKNLCKTNRSVCITLRNRKPGEFFNLRRLSYGPLRAVASRIFRENSGPRYEVTVFLSADYSSFPWTELRIRTIEN
ncbi:hypothetical protein PRIPAC_77348 [Pristionchus pacificus]|uniref:F-box domain-containing protein n=1 Tax=Pristionchus pacificus TaxID=54126 RepID=A0A2A6CKK5_PRIPA|nr:hypothetical protein PRIPAC_77348 [Pristionchus pacificus]|eukprot:PDM78607.1 hypothetical protein PRIPAC_31186 [Pristionchus pacificus]